MVWVAAAKIGPSREAGVVSVISELEPVHDEARMTEGWTAVIYVRRSGRRSGSWWPDDGVGTRREVK